MTRTATIAFSAFSLITVGFVADLHAQSRDPLCIVQAGARDGKAETNGNRIRGAAHYEMRGLQVVHICNELDAANYHKRFKEYGGTSPK